MARRAAGRGVVACVALALLGLGLALVAAGCGGGPSGTGAGGGGGKADDLRDDLPTRVPTRIILFIGDGMGVGQITSGAFSSGEPLAMFSMPEMGFTTTHEHEFVTTDSAASASALAAGVKTHFGAIGVTPGTDREHEEDEDHQLRTVVDAARESGWRTGLISTTSVVDATPAAFAAHRASRRSKNEIALDLRHSGVDVLIGGGTRFFEARPDKQNLLSQMSSAGYSIAKTATGLRRVASGGKTRVVALLAEDEMPEAGARAMELPDMTAEALEILDNAEPDGFFLMVEGAQIDRMSHDLDGPATAAEVRDLDAAVKVALDYARGRDDTLVVVTADHETGGLTVLDPTAAAPYLDALGGPEEATERAAFPGGFGPPPFADLDIEGEQLGPPAGPARLTTAYGYLSLASRPFHKGLREFYQSTHTPTMIATFAEGPAADYAASARDNAELGSRLRALIAAAGQGGEHDTPPQAGTPRSVILILTDELGLSGWTAAHYAAGPLAAGNLPVAGLSATWGHDRLLPDRAAAATAIAGGAPTLPGAVGMIPGTDGGLVDVETLLERAAASGRRTGLVTTAALSDPALAAFYAHLPASGAAERADRLVDAGVDVVFGGGADDFTGEGLDRWRATGATVETGWSPVTGSLGDGRVRLVAGGELDPARTRLAGGDQPTLEEMTRAALDLLDGDDMFLVVYAGGPAARGAALDRAGLLIDEVIDLDRAVQAAVEAAAARGDTAVVVTSLRGSSLSVLDNHYGFHKGECGVETRCGGSEDFPDLEVAVDRVPAGDGLDDSDLQDGFSPVLLHLQYAWLVQAAAAAGLGDPASADLVPLHATGPGTAALEGFGTAFSLGEQVAAWLAD
ncbi:MAG TPA: alkaline phosphatase [Kofleriaceae bacterium]|nr:alkaline phosphatase [Kofleriaceae bacterium]